MAENLRTYLLLSNNITWDSTFRQQLAASEDGEEMVVVLEDMMASLVQENISENNNRVFLVEKTDPDSLNLPEPEKCIERSKQQTTLKIFLPDP